MDKYLESFVDNEDAGGDFTGAERKKVNVGQVSRNL